MHASQGNCSKPIKGKDKDGEVLVVPAWNIRKLMGVAGQVITVHILSKYRVDIACLSELLTKPPPKYDMVIIEEDWNTREDHNAAAMISTR
ncbi:unnamed protein product [Dracunculus medinensis]|uniref:ERCC4 domain-containing protein n=1 Tax=Dracunculus medinensis TaxID=318479 RepID=A0A0N4UIP8_DRAME|nr:unnamed protein product [Dracunculus medinensis]